MEGEERFNQEQSTTSQFSAEHDYTNYYQDKQVDKRSAKENVIVAAVVVVAFLAVFVGYFQMSMSLKSPVVDLFKIQPGEVDCIGGDCQLQEQILAIAREQQKDTDGDGLSDYDELNIYGTSPYLEDSDSDGFTDGEEVAGGYDPNCPGSQDCSGSISTSGDLTDQAGDAGRLLSGQATPETVRNLLLQQGLSLEQLADISDEQLMIVYQQALAGNVDFFAFTEGNGQVSSVLSQTDADSLEYLQGLSGAQIRSLMIEGGFVSSDDLLGMSDEQLKSLFLDQLNSQNN